MKAIEAICLLAFLVTIAVLLWSQKLERAVKRLKIRKVLRVGAKVFYYNVLYKDGKPLFTQVCTCTVIDRWSGDYVKVVWGDGKLGYEKIDGFWESADLIRVWNGDEVTEGGRLKLFGKIVLL